MAFTGDLHLPDFVPEETRALTCESWKKLLQANARRIYPAHGVAFTMEAVKEALERC